MLQRTLSLISLIKNYLCENRIFRLKDGKKEGGAG